MKKFYSEPEFELVNIRLVTDVLGLSTETEVEVPTIDGGGFPGWDDDDWGEL